MIHTYERQLIMLESQYKRIIQQNAIFLLDTIQWANLFIIPIISKQSIFKLIKGWLFLFSCILHILSIYCLY